MKQHHLSAVGTGLLVGVLVGLSSSPVVQTLVTALIAIATAIVGIAPADGAKLRISPTAHTWMAMFGLFAVLGIASGLYVRTHDTLSPSPSDLVRRYRDAGFTSRDARAMLVASQAREGEASEEGRRTASTLFGRGGVTSGCIDAEFSTGEEVVQRFHSEGQPWRGVSQILERLPPETQLEFGRALADGFCPRAAERDE